MDSYTAELLGFKEGGMPPKTKKYFRSTESGAGMTKKVLQNIEKTILVPNSRLL
jgi:hypothetical protein